MISIAIGDEGINLSIDMRSTSQSQFSFFQQQDRRSLRQDKAIAPNLIRTRCPFRLVIARAQGMHNIENTHPNQAQRGISTTSEHTLGMPLLDLPKGLTNSISTSRAASSDRQTGTL